MLFGSLQMWRALHRHTSALSSPENLLGYLLGRSCHFANTHLNMSDQKTAKISAFRCSVKQVPLISRFWLLRPFLWAYLVFTGLHTVYLKWNWRFQSWLIWLSLVNAGNCNCSFILYVSEILGWQKHTAIGSQATGLFPSLSSCEWFELHVALVC